MAPHPHPEPLSNPAPPSNHFQSLFRRLVLLGDPNMHPGDTFHTAHLEKNIVLDMAEVPGLDGRYKMHIKFSWIWALITAVSL